MTFKSIFSDDENLLPSLPEDAPLDKYSNEDLTNLAKSGDYLPRLQLMTSNSKPCKDGKFPINHYACIEGSEHLDLGEEVDVLVVTWRPKALEMGKDAVISNYDQESATFKTIQDKSLIDNSGCMYGPEFFVWIPAIKKWAGYFMGSKTARNEAKSVSARLKKAATLGSRKIEGSKHTWYGPFVTACTTPFELPDQEDLIEQVKKFNNPPAPTAELADKPDEDARSR